MVNFLMKIVSFFLPQGDVSVSESDLRTYITILQGYIIFILLAIAAVIVVMIVAHKAKKGFRHIIRWEAVLAFVLAIVVCANMICYGPMYSTVSAALNGGNKKNVSEETAASTREFVSRVGDEGITLVKNEGLLPLKSDVTKLNVFGWASVYPVYAGTGSGNAGDAMQPTSMLLSLRDAGFEYGAKTGRPRRVGPIDLVATRYGVRCQGATCIALTKMDVMGYMDKIPVCAHYELDGKVTDEFPFPCVLPDAKPVMEYLPGWKCDISAARTWEELPQEARDYVEYIEKNVGCHIGYVSVGPERDSIIVR